MYFFEKLTEHTQKFRQRYATVKKSVFFVKQIILFFIIKKYLYNDKKPFSFIDLNFPSNPEIKLHKGYETWKIAEQN